jgi:hypothetical protein
MSHCTVINDKELIFERSGCWEVMARPIGNALQEVGRWVGVDDGMALLRRDGLGGENLRIVV